MKRIVLVFLVLLSEAAWAQKQIPVCVAIDSMLLYFPSRLDTAVCHFPPDTIVYEGDRYVTSMDLFRLGLRKYHVKNSDDPAIVSGSTIGNTRGYLLECDRSGRITITTYGDTRLPEPPEDQVMDGSGFDRSVQAVYIAFAAARPDNSRLNSVQRNIMTRELYLFVGTAFKKADVIGSVLSPIEVACVKKIDIMPGKFDNLQNFADYLTGRIRDMRFRAKGTVEIVITVGPTGKGTLTCCSNETFRPFFEKTISEMPEKAFSGYYMTCPVKDKPFSFKIYPLLEYKIMFDGKKVNVEYIDVPAENTL